MVKSHTQETKDRISRSLQGKHYSKPVIRLSDGKEYASAKEASLDMGCYPGAVSDAIRRGQKLKGEMFVYKNPEDAPQKYVYDPNFSKKFKTNG